MHRVLQIAIALVVFATLGCTALVVGDDLLTISGRLASLEPLPAECNLNLALLEERVPSSYNSRSIKPEFLVNFAVAPSRNDYRVTISCLGYETIQRVIRSTPPETRIDLGTLTLERHR